MSDFGLDTATADLSLRIGPGGNPIANCDLAVPAGEGSILDAGDYAVITDSGGPGPYRCAGLDGLPREALSSRSMQRVRSIDSVDFTGLLNSPLTAGHSLELKPALEESAANDNVQRNWCRTWAADNRGAEGDGCDEYRVNEILFDPVTTGPDGNDGRAFVEIAGNLPSKPTASGRLGAA